MTIAASVGLLNGGAPGRVVNRLCRNDGGPDVDELDRLLRGISTYQDVVVAGKTERRGARDCEQRWQAIAPHLPERGVLLDVGANFTWFCLRWCQENADRLAVALEADYRSAAVARHVLASHDHDRIVLCTALANVEAVETLARAGQRFDAALCLSVLHWIPDHRRFLESLGRIVDRLFIEQPNPNEAGSGVTAIREAIGDIGPYLRELFADRPVEQVATWIAHRSAELPRELWMVGPPENSKPPAAPSVAVGAVVQLDAAWPPQSWWKTQLSRIVDDGSFELKLTSAGLTTSRASGLSPSAQTARSKAEWLSTIARLPENRVSTLRRRLRRAADALRRRWIG